MRLAHFYHCYADGAWPAAVAAHKNAMGDFPHPFYAGFVGQPENIGKAWIALGGPEIVAEMKEGWEQITLSALHRYAKENDGAVLYAHTKGAWDTKEENIHWRAEMTSRLIARWRRALRILEGGDYQAVGCRWLYPEHPYDPYDPPHFSGNFWMATCDYVRELPPPSQSTRWDAEMWVGQGGPRVWEVCG